jgi:hypothetical protein
MTQGIEAAAAGSVESSRDVRIGAAAGPPADRLPSTDADSPRVCIEQHHRLHEQQHQQNHNNPQQQPNSHFYRRHIILDCLLQQVFYARSDLKPETPNEKHRILKERLSFASSY